MVQPISVAPTVPDRSTSLALRPATGISYAALVSRFHAEPHGKLFCLHGDPTVFRVALSAASQALLRGKTVAVVDGANRFDAYFIAEFARHVEARGGPPPGELLDRIHVSRAFTCYQMEAVITERLPKFLERTGSRIAVVFGPLDTFYDDQAPFFEAKAGMDRMTTTLRQLRDRDIGVLIASQDVRLASRERRSLFPRFSAAMDAVFTVGQDEAALTASLPAVLPPKQPALRAGGAPHHRKR